MLQRLFALLALVGLTWLFRRLLAPSRGGRPEAGGRAGSPRGTGAGEHRGDMVRDRICNTYVPRTRALSVTVAGEEHFFCSQACREAFTATPGS